MPSPASPRPPLARSTLAMLLALAGCGNRGELYLEPSLDDGVDAVVEDLGTDLPVRGTAPPGAPDPSPSLPDGGIAPSVAPDVDAAPAVPDAGADGAGDGEDGDVGKAARRAAGDGA